jgi:hypothetical protein
MLSCIRDAAEGAADIERRASVGAFMERIDQATRPGMPETAQAG